MTVPRSGRDDRARAPHGERHELRRHHDASPVVGVGERAADQHERQRRDELDEPDRDPRWNGEPVSAKTCQAIAARGASSSPMAAQNRLAR